jgi:membrane associated rhomboid family serine protease
MSSPGVPVTLGLVAALIAILGLEFAFGGVSPPVLMRMGALDPDRVREGEAWRLVSYSFLHYGLPDTLVNCFGMLILGRGLERPFGSARMFTIYAAAVVGGGLLPTALDTGPGVGASSGVWGLMVAQAVFITLGHRYARAQMGSDAVWHLALAVLISLPVQFLRGTSWPAHVGGGLGGGAMAFVLLRRLDRMGPASAFLDRGVRRVAVALLIALAAGFVQALLAGKPWDLGAPPHMTRMPVGESGISMEVPRFAGGSDPSTVFQRGVWVLHSGSPWYDLAAIEIEVGTLTFGDDPGGTLPKLRNLLSDPEGAVSVSEPAVHSWKGQTYLRAEWRLRNDLVKESVIALVAVDSIVRVDTYRRSDDELGFAGMAERVALSAGAGPE